MIIERAIVQEIVGRDGQARHYERPNEVREIARRMQAWKQGAPEGCSNCRSANAVTIRTGVAFCAVCREQYRARVAPLSDRGVIPFNERAADRDERGITGLFIVFNSESVDLGGFVEVIKPAAVDRSVKSGDIRALWGHDSSLVLGRRAASTLRVEKQRNGLYGAVDPPAWAANYIETVDRGDVTQASFGFMVLEDTWHFSEEKILREVEDMVVYEISVVAWPAYEKTRVKVETLSARQQRYTDQRLRLAR